MKQEGWKQEAELAVTFWLCGLRREQGLTGSELLLGVQPLLPVALQRVDPGMGPPAPLLPAPRPLRLCPVAARLGQKPRPALPRLSTIASLDCPLFATHIPKLGLKIALPLIHVRETDFSSQFCMCCAVSKHHGKLWAAQLLIAEKRVIPSLEISFTVNLSSIP